VRSGIPNKNHRVSWCFLGPWAVGIRSMVFKPGLTRLVFQMERHEAIDPSATPKTRFPGRKHSTNAPKNQLKIRFCLVSTRSSQMVIIYIYIYIQTGESNKMMTKKKMIIVFPAGWCPQTLCWLV
jgi:hypothetical protein